MDIVTLIGVVGAATILLAFTMNQLGKWSTESRVYDGVNAIGGFLLLAYSYLIESWPFLVLNLVWFLVAARDLVRRR
jgi:hypothetical protein